MLYEVITTHFTISNFYKGSIDIRNNIFHFSNVYVTEDLIGAFRINIELYRTFTVMKTGNNTVVIFRYDS